MFLPPAQALRGREELFLARRNDRFARQGHKVALSFDPVIELPVIDPPHAGFPSGIRTRGDQVAGCPCRMDFSRAEALLIASNGRATSMSFFRVVVMKDWALGWILCVLQRLLRASSQLRHKGLMERAERHARPDPKSNPPSEVVQSEVDRCGIRPSATL